VCGDEAAHVVSFTYDNYSNKPLLLLLLLLLLLSAAAVLVAPAVQQRTRARVVRLVPIQHASSAASAPCARAAAPP
jgi:hypothetical protein